MNRLPALLKRDPGDDPVEMLADGAEHDVASPYEVRDSRPWTQLAVRIGLWAAVGFGCLGGILALLGLASREGDTVIVEGGAGTGDELPAPVASVAERAVRVWLAGEDEGAVETLFVEPPDVGGNPDLEVGAVTTLAGGRWEDGYWLVTMAVDVFECVPVDEEAEDGGAGGSGDGSPADVPIDCPTLDPEETGGDDPVERYAAASTWYVEVGVVGELDGRLAALATPSVISAPPEVAEEWASTGWAADAPEGDDEEAQRVEAFLQAWLAGEGDAEPLLAPGSELRPQDPLPFTAVELVEVAYHQEGPGEPTTVRAHARATTRGGSTLLVGYELVLTHRDDRWEVAEYWGAPSLVGRPPVEEPEVDAPEAEDDPEAEGSGQEDGTEDDDGTTGTGADTTVAGSETTVAGSDGDAGSAGTDGEAAG